MRTQQERYFHYEKLIANATLFLSHFSLILLLTYCDWLDRNQFTVWLLRFTSNFQENQQNTFNWQILYLILKVNSFVEICSFTYPVQPSFTCFHWCISKNFKQQVIWYVGCVESACLQLVFVHFKRPIRFIVRLGKLNRISRLNFVPCSSFAVAGSYNVHFE